MNRVLATSRGEHDRNADQAIFLSCLAPEPSFSSDCCVLYIAVTDLMKVERP